MIDYFESPKLKLARAKKYVDDLERERDRFVDEHPWSHVVEANLDGSRKEYKIKFTRDFPDAFGDFTSNALQNLRSALDHAANASARAAGVSDPRSAYFPFGNDPKGLEDGIKGRCKDVLPDIVTVIRRFKPYRTGNPNPILWAINNTANVDKHAIVHPMAGCVDSVKLSGPDATCRPLLIHPPRWDGAKNEIIYAVSTPDFNPNYNVDIKIDIAFGEIGVVDGHPAAGLLKAMIHEVQNVLVAIEAETRKLGYIS